MASTVGEREHEVAEAAAESGAALTRESVLHDYRLAVESRQTSLLGRKEVLTGKAKFGIFGDGKEVAQLAMARAFRRGDFRAGYYRDQTFMFAVGMATIQEYFAQLYADPDVEHDPATAGRCMNGHFATRSLTADGAWRPLAELFNCSADVSPTASQMPRLVGLAYASRLFREVPELAGLSRFSHHGDEIAFGTIGNASCAEGMFWEAVNAVGVLRSPMLLSIWDDGFGISVPNELQVAKGDLSAILSGFQRSGDGPGYDLYTVRGWDYPGLVETYLHAAATARREHVPAILHVTEMTQPQGHSTSGSQERYKSQQQLEWEAEIDCVRRLRQWVLAQGIAEAAELDSIEEEAKVNVLAAQRAAWRAYREPIERDVATVAGLLEELAASSSQGAEVRRIATDLERVPTPMRRDLASAAASALLAARDEDSPARRALVAWNRDLAAASRERYSSHVHTRGPGSALAVEPVAPVYRDDSPLVNGFELLNACFDAALGRIPELVALGEDLGKLGDVNQGFAGLQQKYGELRVSDTGIREATIVGQAIGMAMRGLRPIAEVQYLDYLLYALQILSDDLATLTYRTLGGQKAPLIVRTRGHRLEGMWHSGSLMSGLLGLLRGMWLLVPRNMTQAAGFYNTLLAADDPAVLIEVLNGYRVKERLPANVGELRLPLGVPEVLRAGRDVTVVTYGALCRIALEAAERLAEVGIEIELVDVQTLLPFDLEHSIVASLEKTNRVLFLDEDVPGGATAYMMQKVLEEQGGYHWLDAEPRTLSSREHRPAYGSDGDYWSKPNREEIFTTVYELMHEAAPQRFPLFYR